MYLWRIGLHCFQHIDQRWQRLPFDLHQFKGIFGNIATFGCHCNHRFTGITYLLNGNRVLDDRLCTESWQWTHHLGRIAASQDRVYARHLFGSAGVDADDAGVSIGTAQHSSMEHTRQLHVVGVLRSTREQIWILAPLDIFANPCIAIGCSYHSLSPLRCRGPIYRASVPDGTLALEAMDWAALCTASIICW